MRIRIDKMGTVQSTGTTESPLNQSHANKILVTLNQFKEVGARVIVSFSSGATCFVGKGDDNGTFNAF